MKHGSKNANLLTSLAASCLVSLILLMARVVATDSMRYVFLIWNLVLAIIPLVLAVWLVSRIKTHGWLRWQQIVLTGLWLVFLPNSFYLITDFVHLAQTHEVNVYFDTALITSFVFNGLATGYLSVYLIHKELTKRFSEKNALILVSLIFLLCSFAIYLGRFTRWNTWDILLRPAGLLFDVSDRFVNPSLHFDSYLASSSLFLVLLSVYLVIWQATNTIKN